MRHKSHHLHSISDKGSMPFDPAEYSKFKYGSKTMARKFGRGLGDRLASILSTAKQYVMIPAPYNYIPTATFALKDYVLAELNKKLLNHGMNNPIQESKIYRPQIKYTAEYGNMSLEERKMAIGAEVFHTDKDFLRGKTALFLDDIRVTGAHEERVCAMIDRLQLECECIFVYFARVEGVVDPKIENYLNYYAMKSLLDLDYIVKNEEFIFNTRNVKFILNAQHEEFKSFINYQRVKFRETLYAATLGNGYHKDLPFLENINYLKSLL